MKESLVEAEDKYRKAMVSNAQLHNEKTTLMYQVETLKEELSDMEELLWESRGHRDDTSRELERERRAHGVLQFQFKEMKETLRQTEELLTEVSDLRLKSSTYCQEVSDLQEVLQWKEKKMAALERQREISDIVRIERDRLRDEAVRLRDALKKHGVVVSPEVSTNGETGRGEDEDDVSAEPATRLAQDSSRGGRESMLGKNKLHLCPGKVREQQPAQGSNMKNRCWIYKRSQSLNVISTSDRTKPDPSKPVRRFDKLGRERRDTRKLTRNKGSETQMTNRSEMRQDGNSLFWSKGIKKQQMKNEPGSFAVTRLTVEDQAFKGRTKPHSESEVKSSVASNQDVLVTEMKRSFDDKICRIQIKAAGTQLLVHQTESQVKYVDLVSPVPRPSTEKVHKSRLVPPRPAKDIIQDNKAIVSSLMAACKQNSLTEEKQKLHVAVVMGNENPSSDKDVALQCLSAVDHIFENQQKDGNACRDVSCPKSPLLPMEMLKDWIRLKKMIQSRLRFIENQGFNPEMSSTFSHIPGPPSQWISDNKETLKNVAKNVSHQCDTVDQGSQSTGQMRGFELTAEGEQALKDLREGSKTPEDPESSELSAAGHSALIKDCAVSGMLEAASLEVTPQTNDVSMENTSEVMCSVGKFQVTEENPRANSVDEEEEEKQIQSYPMMASRSEELVFIETYFAEPAKTKMLESVGSHWDLVDSSRNPVFEVVAKTNKKRETVERSCLVPDEEVVEMQLKRHQTLSSNSHVGQSSKVKRLVEITADEIKAMAVPELMLMSRQDGGIVEDRQSDEPTELNTEDLEELSARDMDSCEEVDEEAGQQPAAQQQPQPVTEVSLKM